MESGTRKGREGKGAPRRGDPEHADWGRRRGGGTPEKGRTPRREPRGPAPELRAALTWTRHGRRASWARLSGVGSQGANRVAP